MDADDELITSINFEKANYDRTLDKRCFESAILDICGNQVGSWKAAVCNSRGELAFFLNLTDEVFAVVESIDSPLWPMAALIEINVEVECKGCGYGSAGLAHFAREAIARKCKSALTQIGFYTCGITGNGESALRENLYFYQKNGWNNLFELDDDGLPSDLDDALLAYRQLCPSAPSSSVTPYQTE